MKAYRAAHPDRVKDTNRRCHQAHREERLQKMKAWQAANPEKKAASRPDRETAAAQMREWRRKNPGRAAAASARWHANNRERMADYQREWKARNPGRSAANLREWRRKNPDRHRAIVHARRAAKRRLNWGDVEPVGVDRVFAAFGGLCAYCMTAPATHLDHYMPLKLGGLHAIDNLMPACVSCNTSKGAKDPAVWLDSRRKVS